MDRVPLPSLQTTTESREEMIDACEPNFMLEPKNPDLPPQTDFRRAVGDIGGVRVAGNRDETKP
jgi:hypothetical protein